MGVRGGPGPEPAIARSGAEHIPAAEQGCLHRGPVRHHPLQDPAGVSQPYLLGARSILRCVGAYVFIPWDDRDTSVKTRAPSSPLQ